MIDIILTTLKPLLKNVTAEDVSASLYYLHLNTEDDARLLEDETIGQSPTVETPVEKPLPRKPLPESAKSSLDLNRNLNLGVSYSESDFPRRKPVSPTIQESNRIEAQSSSVERRPLGPRPLLSEAALTRKPLPGVENTQNRPAVWPPTSTSTPKTSSDSSRSSRPGIQNDSTTGKTTSKPFSITIIRRDPSSGAQWNVGTVEGQPIFTTQRTRKPFFDISVHLTTPGYNQFQNRQPTTSIKTDSLEFESGNNLPNVTTNQTGFERRLFMGGRPAMQHKRAISDFPTQSSTSRGLTERGSLDLPNRKTLDDNAMITAQPSNSTGYTFMSPWGGHCQFSTGIGGRSLKCKHRLPTPVSAGGSSTSTTAETVSELRFNLPSSGAFSPSPSRESDARENNNPKGISVPKFSKIRDKLTSHKPQPPLPPRPDPTSYAALYPSDNEGEGRPSLPPRPNSSWREKRSQHAMGALDTRHHSPEAHSLSSRSENEEDEHLDLSIGREKAGGGNRGKRAKLGKLIIHDEGFKMLDLVVGANMAVWWSVWDGV
jgi:hypothetical protein